MLLIGSGGAVRAQWGASVSGSQFELAETVQLNQADNAVLAQWDRVKALLAERQWDEAVELLRQLAESSDLKMLGVTEHRFVSLRAWCQLRLASLPPQALKLYRARIDPVARQWYEQGIAKRNRRLLENVVDQAFASSFGDDALLALGDMTLESGDYAAARGYWMRILPSSPPVGTPIVWPGYPDTKLDPAGVRARLVLASILEGSAERAKVELAEFTRLHPDARGTLGGKEGKYAELLSAIFQESAAWLPVAVDPNWRTFAGDFRRNKIAPAPSDVGPVTWRRRLRLDDPVSARRKSVMGEDPGEPLSFYPLVTGGMVLANDSQEIIALRADSGKPAWGQAAIYQNRPGQGSTGTPSDVLGVPRFTMTVFQNRLYARMGSPVTGIPQNAVASTRPGCLVCLDLTAEGRLLWKAEPDEGWAFEGSPVADDSGVFVAMRRQDIRPRASVACFHPDTGKLCWRRFVCSAETPARGAIGECTHNLLTLGGGTLYYNTNLGAVAAIRADDGQPLWVSLYPRARHGDLTRLAPHWRRSLNPCVLASGELLVAPADSPRIFSFDATTGQMLWQTGSEMENVAELLGTSGSWLIAGGRKLYWISLRDEDRGHVKHVWPDGGEPAGYGRGLLTADSVLWPTRDKLYVFDSQTAQSRKVIDLAARGAAGGNLLIGDRRLLVATGTELIALEAFGEKEPNKNTQ